MLIFDWLNIHVLLTLNSQENARYPPAPPLREKIGSSHETKCILATLAPTHCSMHSLSNYIGSNAPDTLLSLKLVNFILRHWNGGGGDTWKLKTRQCGPLCLSSWFYNSSVWRAFVSGGACIENKQHIGWLMRLLCVCDWWHKQPSLWPVFLLFNLNALIQGRMTQG